MNYFERSSVINSTNDGNHINRPPDDISHDEVEMCACPTCGDQTTKRDVEVTGECPNCVEDFYRKNFTEGK